MKQLCTTAVSATLTPVMQIRYQRACEESSAQCSSKKFPCSRGPDVVRFQKLLLQGNCLAISINVS